MKKFATHLALFFVLSLPAITNAQTSLNLTTESGSKAPAKKLVDNGYFSYEITGNQKEDAETYRKAKEKFIIDFPEKYKAMIAALATGSTKHLIDKTEFDKMPASKKAEILSHPDKYQIAE